MTDDEHDEPDHDCKRDDSEAWGCARTIVGLLIIWAFLFGVSYGGNHYQVGCSCDHGVEFTKKSKGP